MSVFRPGESAPPPSAALLGAVGSMAPVRSRVPARGLALIISVTLLYPLIVLAAKGVSGDVHVSSAATLLVASVWAAAFALLLARAVVPRRGEVLPDPTRAGRTMAGVSLLLIVLGLLATPGVPTQTGPVVSFFHAWWHCTSFSLGVTLPALVAGAFVLRRLHPFGGWRIAAALGAAGGALGGLTLHFICPFGGPIHVGLAHGGAVVLGAALAAAALGRRIRA